MKQLNFLKLVSYTWLLLLISLASSYAQGPITLSLQYKSSDNKYHVYLKPTSSPTAGTSAYLTDASTNITITAPAGLVTMGTITSVTPSSSWSLVTTAMGSGVTATDQATGTPTGKDFFVFAPAGDFSSITYTSGTEVELFNFSVTGICSGNLDILPSAGQTAGNGTLNIGSYYSVDGYAGGIGTNHFVGTYNMISAIPTAPLLSAITQPTTCTSPGNTGSFTVTTPALGTGYTYSTNGTTYQVSNIFSGLTAGTTYSVSVKNSVSLCTSTSTPAVINAAPTAPAAPVLSAITQPTTCTSPGNTGSFTITSPTGANFEYSINGGTSYQTSTTFSTLAAGTYSVTVRNTTTMCISAATPAVINAAPSAPAAPVLGAITQPTACTSPGNTGSFTVTSPVGANFEYSINGGTSYQTSPTFSSLVAGTTYNVTVRNTTTLCISTSTPAVINAAPTAPAAPTLSSIIQPTTCTTPTGSFSVTNPVGANFEYSINGGTSYQASVAFSALASGTYSVTVRNTTTMCVSPATPAVINAAPTAPAAPTLSTITQPTTCTSPGNTGSFTVTNPIGAGFEYSINGGISYQSSTSFNSLVAGTYSVTVRNTTTMCISAATPAVINAAPTAPAAPTLSAITQPTTCTNPTGSFSVTSPLGAGFEYSINGGTTYQASPTFSLLVAGTTYNVTVRNTTTLCVSTATPAVVNAAPTAPAAPNLSLVDPTCEVTTGSITVLSPTGTFEYSLNGGAYQSSVTFTGIAPGTAYSIVARNTTTLCVSVATSGTIANLPVNCIVRVSPKALLQGAASMTYSPYTANASGLMRDNLRSLNLIPASEPYTALGFTTPAIPSSTVSAAVLSVTGANAIVDWVLVELRDATTPTTILARKAALIQADGDIVDTDGTSSISFGVTNGNYKIAVLHRNHLGVMTAGNLTLSSTTTLVDFTLPTTLVNGTNARATISGKNYLWAGNANVNNTVIAQGASSDRSTVTNTVISASGNTNGVNTFIVNGYRNTDINMDGRTIAQGLNADNSYILNLIINHPANTTSRDNVFIITQQLP